MGHHPKYFGPMDGDRYAEIKALEMERKMYFSTLFIISMTLLALGIVANVIVCFGLYRCRNSRSPTKLSQFFIVQLAITDLVYRAVSVIREKEDKKQDLSSKHCKIAIFSQFSCAAVLFVLLTAIALDRYVHILYPLQSLTMNTRKYLTIFFIWLYAFLISSGFIASATPASKIFKFPRPSIPYSSRNLTTNNSRSFEYKPRHTHCVPGVSGSRERKVAFTMYFVFAFLFQLFLIVLFYTKITIFLWKRTKKNNTVNRSAAKAKLRAIQMFILVVFSFLISWGPIMILDMYASYSIKRLRVFHKFPLRPLFDCVSQTSSILNPFIYAFGDANFKRGFHLCFRRRQCGGQITRVLPATVKESYVEMSNQLSPSIRVQ